MPGPWSDDDRLAPVDDEGGAIQQPVRAGRLEGGGAGVVDQDVGATQSLGRLRQLPRDGAPDAFTRARHQRDLALESQLHRNSPCARERILCRIVPVMVVHLIDGTYELFRYFLSPAAAFDRSAPEALRAVRGVVGSMLGMLEGGATHLGVATDHVIESFRNALWAGYKTGEGMDPLLYAQFGPLEEALRAVGGDGARALRAPRAHSEARHGVGRGRAWLDATGHDAHGATRARVPVPEAGHAACGRAHRRRRGRAALDRSARRLRGVVRTTRHAVAPRARLGAGSRPDSEVNQSTIA